MAQRGKPVGLPKSGGRKPGTRNKITSDIAHTLAQMGCDPIVGMARIAMNKKNDVAIRLRAYAEVAQYQYAKRRAIEITPGKMDPTGAQLVPLDVLLLEYRQLRSGKQPVTPPPKTPQSK